MPGFSYSKKHLKDEMSFSTDPEVFFCLYENLCSAHLQNLNHGCIQTFEESLRNTLFNLKELSN